MTEDSFRVEDAVALARRAHQGQVDKAGEAYIDHPLRVMERVSGDSERMAAVLHDVLEDTDVTAADLRSAGCPEPVVVAVEALTKRAGEPLAESMARVGADPIAVAVKRADLADNADPRRLASLDRSTSERLARKYDESLRLLEESTSPAHMDG